MLRACVLLMICVYMTAFAVGDGEKPPLFSDNLITFGLLKKKILSYQSFLEKQNDRIISLIFDVQDLRESISQGHESKRKDLLVKLQELQFAQFRGVRLEKQLLLEEMNSKIILKKLNLIDPQRLGTYILKWEKEIDRELTRSLERVASLEIDMANLRLSIRDLRLEWQETSPSS